MSSAERVIFALRALGEAGKAATLPQGADAFAPAGEDLVGIGLVPHIPHQTVARSVENMVQRDRQLDHPQPSPEVTPSDCDRADGLGAQLIGELSQRRLRQAPQVVGAGDGVEERGWQGHDPNIFPYRVAAAQPKGRNERDHKGPNKTQSETVGSQNLPLGGSFLGPPSNSTGS